MHISMELINDPLTTGREPRCYEASRPGVPGPSAFRGQQELSVGKVGQV